MEGKEEGRWERTEKKTLEGNKRKEMLGKEKDMNKRNGKKKRNRKEEK